jgi:hypothetical protein
MGPARRRRRAAGQLSSVGGCLGTVAVPGRVPERRRRLRIRGSGQGSLSQLGKHATCAGGSNGIRARVSALGEPIQGVTQPVLREGRWRFRTTAHAQTEPARHVMRDLQVQPDEFRRLLNQLVGGIRNGGSRYARNYARDRPSQAQNQPPPAKHPKKNPSVSPRLTEGLLFARLLDRPAW